MVKQPRFAAPLVFLRNEASKDTIRVGFYFCFDFPNGFRKGKRRAAALVAHECKLTMEPPDSGFVPAEGTPTHGATFKTVHAFDGGPILVSGARPQLCKSERRHEVPSAYGPVARLLKPLRTDRSWGAGAAPRANPSTGWPFSTTRGSDPAPTWHGNFAR